jgi:hypothetical protein
LIKFPGRENHGQQIEEYHSLLQTKAGALSLVTVSTCVSVEVLNKGGLLQGVPRIRWFTLVDADDALIERAKQFARKLNGIEKCKAHVLYGRNIGNARKGDRSIVVSPAKAPVSVQFSYTATTAAERTGKAKNVCPECGHQFKGNGFDGIDAHWRSKHEKIMPYKEAWPLVKSGNYHRKTLQQNR